MISRYKRIFRILLVGPTGSGKSQFCNFVLRDLTNSINLVSDSMDSCTIDPQSNEFKRLDTDFDFIDTAGNSDSNDNDIENLKRLVDYLKKLKKIHYLILVLKFGERFTGDTKQYIEALGKIFTVNEFFSHLCIVFTKFPNQPKEQDLKTKDKFVSEINKLLRKIFKIDDNVQFPDNELFFIDTNIDKENEEFNQKNQDVVDIILQKLMLAQRMYHPINTENLDITGANAKIRRQQEIESLKNNLEEEKRKKELAEKQAEEARKREKNIEKQIEKVKKEMLKAQEEERIRAQNEYNALRRRLEEEQRQNEYERQCREDEYRRNLEYQRSIERERQRINEEIEKKNIIHDNLNRCSERGKEHIKSGITTVLGSIGLGLFGAAVTPFCPILGAALIGGAVGSGSVGAGEAIGGGIGYAVAENKKKNYR